MIWPEQPRFRRLHALLLCVLWMAGFEIGPGLHVALHETIGHHHHGPAPRAEHAHEHDHHEHGHHEHGHHHDHAVELEGASRDHDLRLAESVARDTSDLDHGAHALAHRGVAAVPTPPAWPPVADAPSTSLQRASRSYDPVRSRAPRSVRARGPPVVSLS